MPRLANFPAVEVLFNRRARPVDPAQADALVQRLETEQTTDLLVFAHGWNNNLEEARRLYRDLATSLQAELAAARLPVLASRRFAIAALFWPSKRFTDEDLIPGGAASASSAVAADLERLREPEGFAGGAASAVDAEAVAAESAEAARLDEAERLLEDLEDDQDAQERFVAIVRELLPRDDTEAQAEIPPEVFNADASTLLRQLGRRERPRRDLDPDAGGAAVAPGGDAADGADEGGAAGIADLVGGVRAGARKLLNYTTYYRMKRRAGDVGEGGVFELLERLRRERPAVRLHLVGHSFGGRLVAAAARGPEGSGDDARVATMTLLQAAFSHYGFASDWSPGKDGYFRPVLDRHRVRGPIVVSHTRNDRAVGIAYALASRVMRQVAAAVGDADDKFGGIGSNGAQKSGAVEGSLRASGGAAYTFAPGVIHNLESSAFIADHGDVAGREVAHAILSAVAATPTG